MSTQQGNIKDRSGNIIVPNSTSAAILDVEKSQALSQTLLDTPDKSVLGYNTFSTASDYSVGDIVYYKSKLYKFTSSKSAGAWDNTKVEQTSINSVDNARITALETQNGNSALTTTAQTLSGAVNELDADNTSATGRLTALETQNGDSALTTTAQTLSGAVNELDSDTASITGLINFIHQSFGKYDSVTDVTLSKSIDDKYVKVDGTEVSNNDYAISGNVSLNMGDILLVPSASAVLAECSVVSQKATRTYQKVITYTYTYNALGNIATATDTNRNKVYTYVYDEEGVLTDITLEGVSIGSLNLPTTYEVTENFYVPLVKQSVSSMPSAGYYVYLAPQAMNVVVSGLEATVNGGVCKKVGWGIFKNIASNFVGALAQRTIAEAFADLEGRLGVIEEGLENGFSVLKTRQLDVLGTFNAQLREGGTAVLTGTASPTILPTFIGQIFVDKTNKIAYIACGMGATTDWKRITNA